MSDWTEIKLGELGEVITGKTPSKNNPEDWGNQMPFITPSDYKNYRKYASTSERNLSNVGIERLQNKVLPKNSLLVTCIGSDMGKVVMNSVEAITNQQINSIIPNEEIVDNNFLYYRLVDLYEILRIYGSDGTAVPIVNKGDFENIQTAIPEIDEQKSIADVLSSIDNKIELLHTQNQTIQKLASVLYRQKFIEEATEDWKTEKLGEITDVQNGFAFSSRDYVEFQSGHLEVLKMGHIERGGGLRTNPKKDFVPRSERLKRWILRKGDIIMAMTDMKDNVVILGVPAMIDKDDNYVLNQRVARLSLKSNNKLINNYLLYVQLMDSEFIATLQSKANSGVQVNLSTESIKDCDIIIPPMEVQNDVGVTITNLYLKKENNDIQIQTLTAIRNNLLPKFMNGDISV